MRNIKAAAVWLLMLSRRLLKNPVYILILLLIPAAVFALRLSASEKSGALHVLLVQENESDSVNDKEADSYGENEAGDLPASDLINKLTDLKGVVYYEEVLSSEKALEMVRTEEADAVWIIPVNVSRAIRSYLEDSDHAVFKVYCSEDNIQNQLAREQLFGAVYHALSFEKVAAYEKEHGTGAISRSDLQRLYDSLLPSGSLFTFVYADKSPMPESGDGTSYLTAPVRGLLSVLLFLCGLAASMFYLKDRKDGKFQWLSYAGKPVTPLLYQLAALIPAAAIIYAGLYISGTFTVRTVELPLMLLYTAAVAAFCMLLSELVPSLPVLGALLPVFCLASVILCPVFVNLQIPAGCWLPMYFYLNGLYSLSARLFLLLYAIVCLALAYGIRFIRSGILTRIRG